MMFPWCAWGGEWSFGTFGWIAGIFMVLWWVLVVVVVVLLVRWLVRVSGGGRSASSAVDILNERYAKGEIDRKEFEEKRRDLTL